MTGDGGAAQVLGQKGKGVVRRPRQALCSAAPSAGEGGRLGEYSIGISYKISVVEPGLLLSMWPSSSIGQGPGSPWTLGDKSFWENSETKRVRRLPGPRAEEGHSCFPRPWGSCRGKTREPARNTLILPSSLVGLYIQSMDSSDPSQLLSKTGSVVEAMLNLGEVGRLLL